MAKKQSHYLIDYVTMTKPGDGYTLEGIIFFLGLRGKVKPDDFILSKGQLFGYSRVYRYNNIVIMMESPTASGYCVSMSGQGCRWLEKLLDFKNIKSWMDWLKFRVIEGGCRLTRLDVALDMYNRELNLDTIYDSRTTGNYKSRFNKFKPIENFDGVVKTGYTLYFGSSKSDFQIRFYDKLLERLSKTGTVTAVDREASADFNSLYDIDYWVRCEMQLRDDRALLFLQALVDYEGDIGKVFSGVLANYLNFLEPDQLDTNKSRRKLAGWWKSFLNTAEKVYLSIKAPEKTLRKVIDWVENQVSASLALISLAGERHNRDYLGDLLQCGVGKLSDRHLILLQ